jgi:ATP-dependent Clp protease ATP-binding subunit ClpA
MARARTVDFRNTVIVMTSNLGTGVQEKATFGFTQRAEDTSEREHLQANIEKALREFFRPEFLNRIDEIVIFEPLTMAELGKSSRSSSTKFASGWRTGRSNST